MENFSINFNNFWQNLTNYFTDVWSNPFKLVVMILDFTIVIYSDDCDDTPWCPVGKVVKYDFVCGKKIRITEEYCRFFGGKLENGK